MQDAEDHDVCLKATYKHLRTNRIYSLLMLANDKTTGEDVVVFQSVKTGRVWIRPAREFFDGRYLEVPESQAA